MKHANTDRNQAEIVAGLRALGFGVQDLSGVGGGCPDLLICDRDGWLYLLEVKNPGGRNRLSEIQEAWHSKWPGDVHVVRSLDDVLKVFTRRAR